MCMCNFKVNSTKFLNIKSKMPLESIKFIQRKNRSIDFLANFLLTRSIPLVAYMYHTYVNRCGVTKGTHLCDEP